MSNETLSFETANGATTAYVARPDGSNGKAVVVIQEWWGLNDHIRDIANRWAAEGFTAIAPDLYRGTVATNPDEASKLMHALEIEDGLDTIKNAISAASEKYGVSHFGVTGYCMVGTFALRAACELEGISAAVPFYGDIPGDDVLQKLTVPTVFTRSGTRISNGRPPTGSTSRCVINLNGSVSPRTPITTTSTISSSSPTRMRTAMVWWTSRTDCRSGGTSRRRRSTSGRSSAAR